MILLEEGDDRDRSPTTWLPLVPAARDRHQQNVEAMLDARGHIYYQTLRQVCRGEALAVWYGEMLAHHADIPVLRPENIRGRTYIYKLPFYHTETMELKKLITVFNR